MKALNYISLFALLALGSCTSKLYTGAEYDDLYYLPSDAPVATTSKPVTRQQIVEGNLKSADYYDNIYAADTLVSDEFNDAVDYDDVIANQNSGTNIYNYYDNYSYAGRLNRFYGNYFYPYWRDPFYYSWGYPSFGFGYRGSPYYYDPFYYDPFYYDYGYYGSYYGGYYGGMYGGYYGYSPYYYNYSPFYNNWGYYSNVNKYRDNSVTYGRRERQSTSSTRWNSNVMPSSASSRRDSYISKGTGKDDTRKSVPVGAPGSRRTISSANSNNAGVKTDQGIVKSAVSSQDRATTRSSSVSRPEYKSVNRTYTPCYSNPRMSTRPSYNNSRVNTNPSTGSGRSSEYYAPSRTNTNRSSSSVSAGQSRSSSSYRNSGTYSAPARRSVGSSSGYSSGSYSSGRSYSSSGSSSRDSYSSGSSGSSGSSSSGSSRSSGGSSSSGRR